MATVRGFKVWDDEFKRSIFTPEELAESKIRVALITALAQAEKQGIDQGKLEELTGVTQDQIAEMESGNANPRLDTMLKLLAPLGKTLAVVPVEAPV